MRRERHRQTVIWTIVMLLLPMLVVITDTVGLEILPEAQAEGDCSISGDDTAPAWGTAVEKYNLSNNGFYALSLIHISEPTRPY